MPEQLELVFPVPRTPKPRLTLDPLVLTLADLAMAIWQHGAPPREQLIQLGWTDVVESGDGVLTCTGPSGIRTALYRGLDPVSVAVMVAFGQMGMLWPHALPGYLKEINRCWKAMRAGKA